MSKNRKDTLHLTQIEFLAVNLPFSFLVCVQRGLRTYIKLVPIYTVGSCDYSKVDIIDTYTSGPSKSELLIRKYKGLME